jgi:hypothetical protein
MRFTDPLIAVAWQAARKTDSKLKSNLPARGALEALAQPGPLLASEDASAKIP